MSQYPPAGVVGSADCLHFGEEYPDGQTNLLSGGWPLDCFALNPPASSPPPPPLDLLDCHVQAAMANIQELLYQGDGFAAAVALLALVPGATITRVPNSASVTPGSLIAVRGDQTTIVVSGTTNFQQWALQAMFGAAGAFDYGMYSALALWHDASTVVLDRILVAGASTTGPIRLVGHSYGGAVASIMAARYRLGIAARDMQLLTFGCPHPGDSRLASILDDVTSVHLSNHDDPVTYIPPSGPALALIAWMIPTVVQNRWGVYHPPPGRVRLSETGVRSAVSEPESVYPFLFRLVTAYLASQQPEAIYAHNMWEYSRRIVCPGQVAPSPPPGSPALWLRPDELPAIVHPAPIERWNQAPFTSRPATAPSGGAPVILLRQSPPVKGGRFDCLSSTFDTMLFSILNLPGDFGVYLVSYVFPQVGKGGACLEDSLTGSHVFCASTGIDVASEGVSVLSWPYSFEVRGVLSIWAIRRTGDTMSLRANGIARTSAVGMSGLPFSLDTWHGFRVVLGNYRVWMPEVRVYDREVSDMEDGVIYEELAARYPPGP